MKLRRVFVLFVQDVLQHVQDLPQLIVNDVEVQLIRLQPKIRILIYSSIINFRFFNSSINEKYLMDFILHMDIIRRHFKPHLLDRQEHKL